MRQINPMVRNKSQKLKRASGNVGSATNFYTTRKLVNKLQDSENSDMLESKSLRNLQSDGTNSTETSSKVNSDPSSNEIPREPNTQS